METQIVRTIQQNAEIAKKYLGRHVLLEIPKELRDRNTYMITAKIINISFDSYTFKDGDTTYNKYHLILDFNLLGDDKGVERLITIELKNGIYLSDQPLLVSTTSTIGNVSMKCILI